jgi:hypothetical protein
MMNQVAVLVLKKVYTLKETNHIAGSPVDPQTTSNVNQYSAFKQPFCGK